MTTPAREPGAGSGTAPPGGPAEVAERVERDIAALDGELAEIDMLIQQARSESERHETKRAATAEKAAAWKSAGRGDPMELAELNAQLVNLTKRALVMESQVDVLNGKQKALRRYRDRLASLAEEILGLAGGAGRPLSSAPRSPGESDAPAGEPAAPLPTAISRMVLAAQEDLRRDIARAMHDGPAQSLTNIILQAQIVERLIARDPATAMPEVGQLIAMVQSTLDATKSFIFDVRPMVLDDLGLVPTIRRAARDRGRRAQVAVEFDSLGPDRRLPMELESGLFRMLEEALTAYLSARADRVSIRLDWSDQQLEAVVRSVREPAGGAASEETAAPDGAHAPAPAPSEPPGRGGGRGRGKTPAAEAEMPAALAAMIEDRRGERAAAAALTGAPVAMPAKSWRAIEARAVTLGARAELTADGSEVRLVVDLPPAG
jgi:two-component system sensor histidine kinase DegS